jgi:hypothetical protein
VEIMMVVAGERKRKEDLLTLDVLTEIIVI